MYKVCPHCGDEFQLTASRCPDCDVDLTFPGADTRSTEHLSPTEPLRLLTTGEPRALQDLAEALASEGIPSRIDSDPPTTPISGPATHRRGGHGGRAARLGIYLRTGDLEAAAEIAHELLRSQIPDSPAEAGAGGEVLDACPACQEPLRGDASACASCGLEFAVAEVICPACGSEATSDQSLCGNCGRALDESAS